MDSTNTQGDYSALFRQYIVQSTQAALDRIDSDAYTLSDEIRERALNVLSFVLKVPEAWEYTKELLVVMAPKMELQGYRNDWIPFLQRGIELCQSVRDTIALATLNLHLGFLYQALGELDIARACFTISIEYYSKQQKLEEKALAMNRLAFITYLQNQYDEAKNLVEAVLAQPYIKDDERASSFNILGNIEFSRSNLNGAEEYFRKALDLRIQTNDLRNIARSYRNLGPVLQMQGKIQEAVDCHEKAIALFDRLGDQAQLAVTTMNLGSVYLDQSETSKAIQCYTKAEPLLRRHQDKLHLLILNTNRGIAYRYLKKWKQAEQHLLASAEQWLKLENVINWSSTMNELGLAYLEQEYYQKALTIFEDILQLLSQNKDEVAYQRLWSSTSQHLQKTKSKMAN